MNKARDNSVPEEYQNSYLLLWDGDCNFCRNSVEWLKRKAPGRFVESPYQQNAAWLPPEIYAGCKKQFCLRTPQGNYVAGGDALILLFQVTGPRALSRVLGLPGLRQLTRLAYWVVARNRAFLSRFLFQ